MREYRLRCILNNICDHTDQTTSNESIFSSVLSPSLSLVSSIQSKVNDFLMIHLEFDDKVCPTLIFDCVLYIENENQSQYRHHNE